MTMCKKSNCLTIDQGQPNQYELFRYIIMGITFSNSFLKNTGFPKDALLDIKNPVQSITNFINFAAKKYLDAEVNAREYVEPAVRYTKVCKL